MTSVVETEAISSMAFKKQKVDTEKFEEDGRIFEYSAAANPKLEPIPVAVHPPSLHESGPTRIIPFDLRKQLGLDYQATSPNLMAAFLRINPNESLDTKATATSQAFYVIRGNGSTTSEFGEITWKQGDLFVFPSTLSTITHNSLSDTALYWVTDEPLLQYLGVTPNTQKFQPTVFRKDRLVSEVEILLQDANAKHRNRLGILLGNKSTENSTLTLTHTLWSLLNTLPPKTSQRPHRHNSVAIDLCVSAAVSGVYTLMGPELTEDGWVKDPVRCEWSTGGAFVTPPGWWHSHHNETDTAAWVLPMQDAGLYTYQRTLDIRFAQGENKIADTKE
eukprot:CAMPEP_0182418100 /NCGR_PEP_ID=MMETSP1167-20130531/2563_1 /TAXON_ID=2988 /ORGANISM="Mallomonas Sp, Strain CCMP3275" /LENGTH=332 /DNA_ID=CAMNT_0024592105 /DNA_START=88 /DNA_END=1086 /DNA_ORIENTATION=+